MTADLSTDFTMSYSASAATETAVSASISTPVLPVTETLAGQFLSLPIYAELQSEQVSDVVMELEKILVVEAA